MPRKPIVRSQNHYYHVVARVNNKEQFPLPLQDVWSIFIQHLSQLQKEFQLKIGGVVLMNNHFHLLLLSPKEDIDRVMYFLMKNVTKTIQKRSGRINRIFGGRYKGCVIEKERYLLNVYKYIYRNPIAAGIVSRAEDYPYSSFSYELSKVPLKVEIESLFGKTLDLLDWVNQSYKQEEAESIAYGLKRTNFQFKRDRSTNKIIIPV